jgi:hypothetical protein
LPVLWFFIYLFVYFSKKKKKEKEKEFQGEKSGQMFQELHEASTLSELQ